MTGSNRLENFNPERTISPAVLARPRGISAGITAGVLCFTLSLFLYYGTVLRVHFHRTDLLDLGPFPDAVEYFAQANSILKNGAPAIQIGYDRLPSRYPPGYPLLMIPWLTFLPHAGILAPFRTNQTIGLLLLLGSFLFYFLIGRPMAGGLAALLLASQPAFITMSRSSMSDLSGAAAAVLAFALVYIGLQRRRRWPIYSAAVVLGLSLCIRPQLLFFAPVLVAMALFPSDHSWSRWLTHCSLTVAVFAIACLPYLLFNTLEFGHPLRTGYDFWVPGWTESGRLFSLHNVPSQLSMLWSELTATWRDFRVANLFGTGTYVVPPFILLALIGVAFVRLDRFAISSFCGATSYFAATLLYAFVDGRFYLPLFFLLAALAVLPVEWAVSRGLSLRFPITVIGVLVLFLLTCVGYPSQAGFEPKGNRFQAWEALDYANSRGMSARYQAQDEFTHAFRDAPGIVLSDIDSPYLNVLLPKGFVAAPIDDKHNYCYSRQWHYGKIEAARLVEDSVGHTIPVYALLLPSHHVEQDKQRLPAIDGYSWQRSDRSGLRAVIMIFQKDTTSQAAASLGAPSLEIVAR